MKTFQIKETHGLTLIEPVWQAPQNVLACTTTRLGGVSKTPFAGLNLGSHVGDASTDVQKNRAKLVEALGVPIHWLDQQHTTQLVEVTPQNVNHLPPFVADACWTSTPGLGCCVMTADCLPILVTNRAGTLVAAIHGGWKGVLNGIVSRSILALPESPEALLAWVGPAISQTFFEVGMEVYDAFCCKDADNKMFFKFADSMTTTPLKCWLNLPGLVEYELLKLGVGQVVLSGLCSYQQEDWFYSYRRQAQTGRMASVIAIG